MFRDNGVVHDPISADDRARCRPLGRLVTTIKTVTGLLLFSYSGTSQDGTTPPLETVSDNGSANTAVILDLGFSGGT
jgi:hypothetical protein